MGLIMNRLDEDGGGTIDMGEFISFIGGPAAGSIHIPTLLCNIFYFLFFPSSFQIIMFFQIKVEIL